MKLTIRKVTNGWQLVRELSTHKTRELARTERHRMLAILDLCESLAIETDPDEQQNIARTLDELLQNEPLELPTEEWE